MEKVEYRCPTTNLPLCNDTIILLKITLLHCVSVVTNYIIPKRDKQTKNITLFRLQPACDPRPPPYMVTEEVRPIFAPPNVFDPISSFAARGY